VAASNAAFVSDHRDDRNDNHSSSTGFIKSDVPSFDRHPEEPNLYLIRPDLTPVYRSLPLLWRCLVWLGSTAILVAWTAVIAASQSSQNKELWYKSVKKILTVILKVSRFYAIQICFSPPAFIFLFQTQLDFKPHLFYKNSVSARTLNIRIMCTHLGLTALLLLLMLFYVLRSTNLPYAYYFYCMFSTTGNPHGRIYQYSTTRNISTTHEDIDARFDETIRATICIVAI